MTDDDHQPSRPYAHAEPVLRLATAPPVIRDWEPSEEERELGRREVARMLKERFGRNQEAG